MWFFRRAYRVDIYVAPVGWSLLHHLWNMTSISSPMQYLCFKVVKHGEHYNEPSLQSCKINKRVVQLWKKNTFAFQGIYFLCVPSNANMDCSTPCCFLFCRRLVLFRALTSTVKLCCLETQSTPSARLAASETVSGVFLCVYHSLLEVRM